MKLIDLMIKNSPKMPFDNSTYDGSITQIMRYHMMLGAALDFVKIFIKDNTTSPEFKKWDNLHDVIDRYMRDHYYKQLFYYTFLRKF